MTMPMTILFSEDMRRHAVQARSARNVMRARQAGPLAALGHAAEWAYTALTPEDGRLPSRRFIESVCEDLLAALVASGRWTEDQAEARREEREAALAEYDMQCNSQHPETDEEEL
jgi:hypothetical protein